MKPIVEFPERSRKTHWIVTRVTGSMLSLGQNHGNNALPAVGGPASQGIISVPWKAPIREWISTTRWTIGRCGKDAWSWRLVSVLQPVKARAIRVQGQGHIPLAIHNGRCVGNRRPCYGRREAGRGIETDRSVRRP